MGSKKAQMQEAGEISKEATSIDKVWDDGGLDRMGVDLRYALVVETTGFTEKLDWVEVWGKEQSIAICNNMDRPGGY